RQHPERRCTSRDQLDNGCQQGQVRSSTPISVGVPGSGEVGLAVRRSLIVASQRQACLPR
ncbi:MAG: hypothetical protein ACRDQH_07900, partial [Pseudonocardiaceae bacterium]